jgi:hypothetical protein
LRMEGMMKLVVGELNVGSVGSGCA